MPLELLKTDNSFFNRLNTQYGQGDLITAAKKIFKESVNVGEAVVDILSHTGIAGFKFNIPESEQIKLRSEITDHYTDINNPIQDHIAHKPIEITLSGLHGEYFYSVHQIKDALAKVTPTLSLVNEFLPKISNSAKQALTKKYKSETNGKDYVFENGVLKSGIEKKNFKFNISGIDAFKLFQDIYKLKSAQTRAYFFFEALWKTNALFSVETSFKRFDNMAIINVTPSRDKNADICEFSITVKQLSFTESKTANVDDVVGRMTQMVSQTVNKGIDKGKEVATL